MRDEQRYEVPTLRMAGHRYACWASMRLDKQRGDKLVCICELQTDPVDLPLAGDQK